MRGELIGRGQVRSPSQRHLRAVPNSPKPALWIKAFTRRKRLIASSTASATPALSRASAVLLTEWLLTNKLVNKDPDAHGLLRPGQLRPSHLPTRRAASWTQLEHSGQVRNGIPDQRSRTQCEGVGNANVGCEWALRQKAGELMTLFHRIAASAISAVMTLGVFVVLWMAAHTEWRR